MCFFFFLTQGTNTETDAGGKFTWALKQSPWRPGFKCVCVLCVVSTYVCRLMCDVSQRLTRRLIQKCVSLRKDGHASIWRAKSTVSVSGQLVPCDDRRTLARRETGEVLLIIMQAWKWDLKAGIVFMNRHSLAKSSLE